MKIALINPAPMGPNLTKWGDYHFGGSLSRALESLGASVTQHYWPKWEIPGDADLVVALRGKRAWTPPARKLSFLWIISHPATVSYEEMVGYDLVLTASETHRKQLTEGGIPAQTLRQCTEGPRQPLRSRPRRRIVFVGNSRGVARPILRWCLEAGVRPEIVGRHWQDVGLGQLVTKSFIPNEELLDFYAGLRLCLNDHWGDMQHYGYINNRIFDALAVGTPILTDRFPELEEVCGDSLLYADGAGSVRKAMERYHFDYPVLQGQAEELWNRIGHDYTFERRAAQLLSLAGQRPSAPRPRPEESGADQRQPLGQALVASILATASPGKEVRVLHLCPSLALGQTLAACEGINYLSAGSGDGPWHVATDATGEGLSKVPGYDVVVLDEGAAAANGELKKWLDSARALTRPKGRTYLAGEMFAAIDPELTGVGSMESFAVGLFILPAADS